LKNNLKKDAERLRNNVIGVRLFIRKVMWGEGKDQIRKEKRARGNGRGVI